MVPAILSDLCNLLIYLQLTGKVHAINMTWNVSGAFFTCAIFIIRFPYMCNE